MKSHRASRAAAQETVKIRLDLPPPGLERQSSGSAASHAEAVPDDVVVAPVEKAKRRTVKAYRDDMSDDDFARVVDAVPPPIAELFMARRHHMRRPYGFIKPQVREKICIGANRFGRGEDNPKYNEICVNFQGHQATLGESGTTVWCDEGRSEGHWVSLSQKIDDAHGRAIPAALDTARFCASHAQLMASITHHDGRHVAVWFLGEHRPQVDGYTTPMLQFRSDHAEDVALRQVTRTHFQLLVRVNYGSYHIYAPGIKVIDLSFSAVPRS